MDTKAITNFMFEIATLRRIIRAHGQVIPGVSENISDHSFRVAVIGMILAKLEKCDDSKVMKMCLFHDIAEARTGDANFINKQYNQMDEQKAINDQMEGLPIGEHILEIMEEYNNRESRESITAKDADLLDQMVLQQEHFINDGKNRELWHNHCEKGINTESAKEIAKSIRASNPFQWLYDLAEKKTGRKVE